MVLARVMLYRMVRSISEYVNPESQSIFHKDCGTVDMIFIVRKLQERY